MDLQLQNMFLLLKLSEMAELQNVSSQISLQLKNCALIYMQIYIEENQKIKQISSLIFKNRKCVSSFIICYRNSLYFEICCQQLYFSLFRVQFRKSCKLPSPILLYLHLQKVERFYDRLNIYTCVLIKSTRSYIFCVNKQTSF